MSSKSGGAKRNTEGEKVIADNRKANYLFSINKQELQTQLNRVGFSNIMNYDPNNTTLKSLINVIYSHSK